MVIFNRRQRRRWRAALIAILCITAISIKSILTEDTFIDNEYELDTESMDNNLHRILSYTASNGDTILHPNQVAELQQQQQDTSPPYPQLIATNQTLPPYHLKDALQIAQLYDHTYLLLVYEPNSDTFYGLYHKNHKWTSGNHKLLNSFNDITYMLRKAFTQRFVKGESDELVIPISSGDFPSIKTVCLNHFKRQLADDVSTTSSSLSLQIINTCTNSKAPVLNFGSVFNEESIMPNMIAMPMPEPHHLPCFRMWADKHQICDELQPKQFVERRRNTGELYKGRGQSHYQMVYGKEYGIDWDDLIPQVVWRGTDFSYLSRHNSLRKIQFNDEVFTSKEAAVVEYLMSEESYNTLLPRWKATVLTAEAEVNTKSDDEIPWANMKFSSYINRGSKTRTQGSKQYKKWEDIDMATGEYLGSEQLLHYKYHIDLGGGGGTTWSGTIIKLALPGLLFHHVTPAKDYIHDYMKPMVHYVPIKEDLSDLKEKFEWAESHPDEAKQIANEATKLMRYLTSEEGFREMYQQRIVEPLKIVIDAYQPLSATHFPTTHAERLRNPNKSSSWKDVKKAIAQIEGEGTLRPVIECAHSINACITTGVRNVDPHSTWSTIPFPTIQGSDLRAQLPPATISELLKAAAEDRA